MKMDVQAVLDLQQKIAECPKAWMVEVTVDGETSLEAVYDSAEAAGMHRDWLNKMPRYYGRATIRSAALRNIEIARAFSENAK